MSLQECIKQFFMGSMSCHCLLVSHKHLTSKMSLP
uniref:Subtilisin-like protease n=1 Tax=Rhizophora mucronata TaxID=61149 RepID=A0A2P2PQY8_RHIMU